MYERERERARARARAASFGLQQHPYDTAQQCKDILQHNHQLTKRQPASTIRTYFLHFFFEFFLLGGGGGLPAVYERLHKAHVLLVL